MPIFSKAMLLAAMAASPSSLALAKKGKMFESDAYVTPKRNASEQTEPYLKQNYLSLHQYDPVSEPEEDSMDYWYDVAKEYVSGGALDEESHIITTSDIDNYFNL